jgi:hypothetical protein
MSPILTLWEITPDNSVDAYYAYLTIKMVEEENMTPDQARAHVVQWRKAEMENDPEAVAYMLKWNLERQHPGLTVEVKEITSLEDVVQLLRDFTDTEETVSDESLSAFLPFINEGLFKEGTEDETGEGHPPPTMD